MTALYNFPRSSKKVLISNVPSLSTISASKLFISNDSFNSESVSYTHLFGIACGIFVGLITVLIAANAPAKHAAKVSPCLLYTSSSRTARWIWKSWPKSMTSWNRRMKPPTASSRPVSYTHLDVYKRQVRLTPRMPGIKTCWWWAAPAAAKPGFGSSPTFYNAVSYTHLDVYKRQLQ